MGMVHMAPLMHPAPMPTTVKLRYVSKYRTATGGDYGAFQVTLPIAIVRALGWKDHDDLEAVAHKDGILIRKPK